MIRILSFLFVVFFAPIAAAETIDVYFGTGNTKAAIGIFHSQLDTDTGKLSEAQLVAGIKEPEFLDFHPNGTHLYAVAKQETPVVASFKIEPDASLTLVNTVPMKNGQGAHLAIHPSGEFLITAQYFHGSVGVFSIRDDGSVGKQTQVLDHEGPSGVHQRQKAPHPHWTGFSPDGRFAFVPDLGTDKIHIYEIDSGGPLLTPHGHATSVPGGGPRHMRFSTNGKFIYLLNELTVDVSTFSFDPADGSAELLHTTPALSAELKSHNPYNSASEILVHPNGRFIYTANRGHDSISVFETSPNTGDLTLVQIEPIRGSWPRNTRIDPTGKWLIVSGEASNTVSAFSIDQETGRLTFPTRNVINVPSVYSIRFRE